jgi:acetate---CoA ligase (ADP-forming)
MLEARSVAVVGASVRPGSLGLQMVVELDRGRYEGAVYPVNPSYEEVLGHRCFASLSDLPEAPDLVILGVSNARIEQALTEAASVGARSAVTFSSLYEEPPHEPEGPTLAERVAAIARDAGMSLCGGNGMGFVNMDTNLRATGFATPDALRSGPVAFISHSGSAFAAFAFNGGRFGFNLLISSGQEIVTGLAEYMDYALGRDSTKVLGLLIEAVREPDAFCEQLRRAAEHDVPVVALKVGRAEGSKSLVTAHSGSLAGEDGAFEAVFDSYGVLRVRDLDEMADTLELLACPRRIASGSGIATVHDSGGERALMADLADDAGVAFADVSAETLSRIQAALDPGLIAGNPLDAWGTGIDSDEIFTECLLALHDDPQTAAVALVVDLTHQDEPADEGYVGVARRVFSGTTKPFCVVSNLAATVDPGAAEIMRAEGIPVLEGASSALVAMKLLSQLRDYRARPPIELPAPVDPVATRDMWRAALGTAEAFNEARGLAMLHQYGIPVIRLGSADLDEAALDVAEDIGFPVALKTANPEIQHKSDVGGVVLGIENAEAFMAAYDEMSARLGPRVTVSAMAPNGVEIALGMVRDPQFGPLVVVGTGGVLVEVIRDRVLAIPPIDPHRAKEMIARLGVARLLEGVRGSSPADVDALAHAISRLSLLATDLGDLIDALDVNPVIVSEGGCVAVDALVLPARG